jgi:sugar phosphate isomerase/epimerase
MKWFDHCLEGSYLIGWFQCAGLLSGCAGREVFMSFAMGAFSPEIARNSLDEVFRAAARLGFTQMQYAFVSSHGEEMPERLHPGEAEQVADAARRHGIRIVAVNGTYNMADPDPNRRAVYEGRFARVAEACAVLGCKIVTICTGSRHPDSMWRWHPDTATEAAWSDLIASTRAILPLAEKYDLLLGVETEASNVCATVEKTRRYLDEIGSPRLKVIMDCANLFPAGTARLENVRPTIDRAFALLGQDIVLAHGKDVLAADEVRFAEPGLGIVDYPHYFSRLREYGYRGGLILHGIHDESGFAPSVARMRAAMEMAGK